MKKKTILCNDKAKVVASRTRSLIGMLLLFTIPNLSGCGSSAHAGTPPIPPTTDGTRPPSVTDFGAVGDGQFDSALAINTALAKVVSTGGELYFPCGTYVVRSPLILTAPVTGKSTGSIVGETATCAIIRYAGTIAAPVLTVTTGVSLQYFSGFYMGQLTVIGNAFNTDDVLLIRPANFVLDDISMWGANPTSGDCLQLNLAIGGKVDTPLCTPSIGLGTSTPYNGLVFKGASAGDQTGALSVLNPVVEDVSGTGVDLLSSSLIFMDGAQTTGNGQSLNVDGDSFKNNFVDCLFENSPRASYVGGYSNVLDNDTFSYFSGNPNTIDLQIDGRQNTLSNAVIQWGLQVLSTASQANLADDLLGSSLSDQGSGTKLSNTAYANPGQQVGAPESIDSSTVIPGYAGSGVTNVQVIQGSWVFAPGGTALSPTVFHSGASWRAIFLGKFSGVGSASALMALPTYTELTESANRISMPSTATLSFGVNTSGIFSVSGGSGGETFNGMIIFMLDTTSPTSGPNSASFSGSIYAPSILPANGFTGTKTTGNCTFTIVSGIITAVTGC